MKSENFVIIQGWMCNELELKGNDLLVYALIYGFSQDGESAFHGSRSYIANTFNISKPTVDKAIQNLLDRGYIVKYDSEDSYTPNAYAVNIQVVKKLYWGGKETLQGGGKETLLNNTSKQTQRHKKNNSKELLQTSDFKFGDYSKSTPKENLYSKCISLIYNKTEDDKIRQLLINWLNMILEKYRSRGKVLYTNVFKGKLNMLDKFDKNDWAEIIEYNLQRGYEGFYPIPVSNYSNNIKDKPWETGVSSAGYTDEEKEQLAQERDEMIARGERVWF